MKRIEFQIGIWMVIITLLFTGCTKEDVQKRPTIIVEDYNGTDMKKINQYHMDLVFDPKNKTIKGNQRIEYINQENISLNEVYFHLYPNVFSKKETAPFWDEDFKEAYPNGFGFGGIKIKEVSIDNQKINYTIEGKDDTIMKVPLLKSLKPGEKVTIEMTYTIKLPPARERFGYGEDIFNLGNFYPIAAVYDETGWNLDPYYVIGDPFYSDVSNYDVHIETPKDYIVAASGNIIKDQMKDQKRKWEIEAKLMRDFAFVTSNRFEVENQEVEGTTLNMYFLKDKNIEKDVKKQATKAAQKSLQTFNKIYGKYPYGQYSVVQTNFPSGMEYPGIVLIDKNCYDENYIDYLEMVIVHESAHQWWYGVVGNDEIDEAWLDEGLTNYAEVIYTIENYGKQKGKEYHKYMNEQEYEMIKKDGKIKNERILRPLDEFEGWEDYGVLVYNKGAMFMHSLYEKYGKEKFYEMMNKYYETYKFKNATTKDFQKICEEVMGENMEDLFKEWIYK